MALLVGSIVFLSATKIDEFFGAGDPNIFRIVALLAVIKGLNQVPDALLKRDLDFRKRVRSDLTRAIGRLVITTSLLLAGVGPISMVIGVTAAEFLGGIVTWYNAKFRPGFRFDWPVAEEMLKFGAAMFGSRLLGMLWLNGDYLVVSNRYGSRSKEYGNYYTAFRLPELVLGSVYNIFANVSFPAFSRARRHGMEELRKVSLRALKYLCMYGFAMGVTMALGARDFITWWFPKFQQAIVPMEILCAVGGFAAIGFASGDIFAAIGKPRLGMYFNLVGAPVLIGGFLAVADRGIVAIAAVHAVVIVPYSMFRIEVANRLIGTTWRQSLRALRPAAVTVMGITAVALPVRLGTSAGFGSGLAIAAASIVGGLVGLSIGDRSSFIEFKGIGAKAIAKVM
jgi:PST family polysaccharide transporter